MGWMLRIRGPGQDRQVALATSGSELTIGRDPDVDVQLTEADRIISRKHLAIRQFAGGVELRVTSAINGVRTSRVLAMPGEIVPLEEGDFVELGPYVITIASDSFDDDEEEDEEDSPPPHSNDRPALSPPGTVPAPVPPWNQLDLWQAFARGAGLPSDMRVDEATAEQAGALVRMLTEGISSLLCARANVKRELRARNRTIFRERDNNPLKAQLPTSDLIQYLFAPPISDRYMPADRAVHEGVAELRIHEQATLIATRAAIEGTFREFEPEKLRAVSSAGWLGSFRLFADARSWREFERFYGVQQATFADWVDRVVERYFTPNYQSESERLKQLQGREPSS